MWIANLYLLTTFVAHIRKPEPSDTQYKHTEVWSEKIIHDHILNLHVSVRWRSDYTYSVTKTLLTTVFSHVKIKVSLKHYEGSESDIGIDTLIFNLSTRASHRRTFTQGTKEPYAWRVQNWSDESDPLEKSKTFALLGN